jgi:hypothetical protein
LDPDPDPDPEPDPLVRGTDRGSGSAPKCHGSPTLKKIHYLILEASVSLSFSMSTTLRTEKNIIK